MHNADFLLFQEKNPENLSHFSDFHGSKVKGFNEADIEPLEFLLLLRRQTIELRERHSFFVHFQAEPFPQIRFSFIFFDALSKYLSLRQQRCCRENLCLETWVLPKTSLNATVPFLLFSYWQIKLPLLCRERISVPDSSGVQRKHKHRQDRERVFYMNEITIAVKYDNDNPTVSGRELHAALEVQTPYRMWFPRMCEYGFTENVDYSVTNIFCSYSKGGSQGYIDHQLTIDMAKELCMIQRTEIGKCCREYFINLEKQWNSPDAVMARALQIADQKLELAKQQNGSLIETTAVQAKQIEVMKPKADYCDMVLHSEGLCHNHDSKRLRKVRKMAE